MRRGVIAVVALAVTAVPAVAAQGPTVTASNYRFTPRELTIAPGETVTFAISSGFHNFRFDDGPGYPEVPSEPDDPAWDEPPQRTFDVEGTYRYHCEAHPDLMDGVITVEQDEPAPDPAPDPSDPPPGDPPPGGGGTTDPPPAGGDEGAAPVTVRMLRVARPVFCARRGPGCRRPGVRLRIDLSRAAAVAGTLRRRPLRGRRPARRFGRVDLGMVDAGPRTLRFRRAGDRRLKPGRYVLALSIGDDVTETLRFRVRRPAP